VTFYSFQILVEKEPEDHGYYAYVPSLPGCFSNGATIKDAKSGSREALQLHLERLEADGMPIPQDGKIVHVEELSIGYPA